MRIYNEITQSKQQILIIIFALVFSISSFILLDSFKYNIQDTISQDSKSLAGGDILITSHEEFSSKLNKTINQIKTNPNNLISNTLQFTTIVYSNQKNTSLLSQIKLVDNYYPLYGSIQLKGGNFSSYFLKNKEVVVESNLLERLNLKIGDSINIGGENFLIKDIIIKEPDRPLTFFSIGPRIIAKITDFKNSTLIGEKSRVEYQTNLKIGNTNDIQNILTSLKKNSKPKERVELYSDKENSIKNFINSFLLFLQIIVFFSIVLGGLGINSALSNFFNNKRNSIAIRKTLGETNHSIVKYYIKLIFLCELISSILIIFSSYILIYIVPYLLGEFLPIDLKINLSIIAVIKGFLLLFTITFIFSIIPLKTLQFIRPLEILRNSQEIKFEISIKDKLIGTSLLIVVGLLVLLEFKKIIIGIEFLGGFFVLFTVIYFMIYVIIKILKKIKFKSFIFKLSVKNILRKNNNNLIMLTTLTCALTLIFSIFFLQTSLQNQFENSFTSDSPNVFFIDIQSFQINNFTNEFKNPISIFPIVRGRIISINNIPIKNIIDNQGPRDSIRREFSLTYRTNLIKDEKLLNSKPLFLSSWNKSIAQVSIMDQIAKRLNAKIGDTIKFSIQGVEIDSQIVSVRTRTSNKLEPFFYFIFEPEILKKAPQTIFASTNLPEKELPKKQIEIAKKYPNITTIDLTQILKIIKKIISKLSLIISFFTLLSITSGLLIFISSIYSTAQERIKESVYYKLIGMTSKDIQKIFFFEFGFLGLISSLLSLILAHIISSIISNSILNIDYSYSILTSFYLIFGTVFILSFIGIISSIKIIKKRPIEFLRETNRE